DQENARENEKNPSRSARLGRLPIEWLIGPYIPVKETLHPLADASPFSAWINGASSVTVISLLDFAIWRVTFTETAGPSKTSTVRFSSRKPARVTVNVYVAGARKKNR